jgi:diguanylate cyclase (GGDEF)-like protein
MTRALSPRWFDEDDGVPWTIGTERLLPREGTSQGQENDAGTLREDGFPYGACRDLLDLLTKSQRIAALAQELQVPEDTVTRLVKEIIETVGVAFGGADADRHELSPMAWLGWRDAVTGLMTRNAGEYHLRWAIDLARRHRWECSVAFVDVDNLKSVNDGEGHAAGDRLLRDVGRTLKASVRQSDRVFRWGGDEFLVVLLQTARESAQALMQRVRRDASHLAFSFGVAQWAPGETPEQLVHRADVAMYGDKAARNGS